MTEQVNPTNEDSEEIVEAVAETAAEVVEETVAEVEVAEVTEEVVAEVEVAEVAEEAVAAEVEEKKEELPLIRKVAGPPQYVARERQGRVRRIGNDVRLGDIDYRNIVLLSRFLDPRGRIIPRRKTRVSAKVQRRVVTAVKRARHMALLPYTGEHIRITRKRR